MTKGILVSKMCVISGSSIKDGMPNKKITIESNAIDQWT